MEAGQCSASIIHHGLHGPGPHPGAATTAQHPPAEATSQPSLLQNNQNTVTQGVSKYVYFQLCLCKKRGNRQEIGIIFLRFLGGVFTKNICNRSCSAVWPVVLLLKKSNGSSLLGTKSLLLSLLTTVNCSRVKANFSILRVIFSLPPNCRPRYGHRVFKYWPHWPPSASVAIAR